MYTNQSIVMKTMHMLIKNVNENQVIQKILVKYLKMSRHLDIV